jgi:hypothetical protein
MMILEILQAVFPLLLGGVGVWATWYYSKQANKREDDRILKELFTEFNMRYDKLNNDLGRAVLKTEIEELDEKSKDAIIDYFNLCAEQYMWFKRGRIDEVIWKSWNAGMNYWYKQAVIKQLWMDEIRTKNGKMSYYISNGDEFFKDIP